ncbi:hypothetical protein SETIT_6G049300v2 [Setaria italica]|uniref:Uncharacterized protein n=1 Tax=Setaria italica TaxID=4555 RepID=A0A368RI49_SETIT|nr:uncharacterized protein DKFZp434B061-like [Setaria italica]RCV29885.1 hypothetical protein SETIT_6G049300v2 [Setaria italica]
MARATAPSRRPPNAVAAPSPPAAAAPVRVPQRRGSLATARGALSHPPKGGTPSAAPHPAPPRRRAPSCACSPTTHPGSFRCALHRGQPAASLAASTHTQAPVSSRLSAPRRASMANPLVRIAAVEGGDQIRRALASLVRPPPSSSQQHRRRGDAFRRRPSRLSAASSAADDEPTIASP